MKFAFSPPRRDFTATISLGLVQSQRSSKQAGTARKHGLVGRLIPARTGKRAFLAALALLGVVGMGDAALAAPRSAIHQLGEKGSYEIGFQSYVVTDDSRDALPFADRPIPVYVFYPVDGATIAPSTPQAVYPLDPLYGFLPGTVSSAWETYGLDRAYQSPEASSLGPFPLVMFSPGWGVPGWAHLSIGARLASHGFVVAIVTHFGDGSLPWEPRDHVAMASFNRPRDISFTLDRMLEWNDDAGHLLGGTIHPDRVAAAGWSLGGYAAMALAAGDDSVCDKYADWDPPPPVETCAASPADPRIRAIVPLDGSNQSLFFYELARIEVPAMGMGQEWNLLAAVGEASWQARQHAAFSGHPSYRVDVANVIHSSFSDRCLSYPVLGDYGLFPPELVDAVLANSCAAYMPHQEVTSLITKYMVGFLKTELVGESGYKNLLTPGWALTQESAIEFFVTEKKSPHSINEDWPDWFAYFLHQPGSAQAIGATDPPETTAIAHHAMLP
jgi:dienelactone hydrolase